MTPMPAPLVDPCCPAFSAFSSSAMPDVGYGSIGWVTDQGPPHYECADFRLSFCPFCGKRPVDPDGKAIP